MTLSGNGIKDDHAVALGEMLKGNKTLRALDLRRNNIGPTGAAGLALGLRKNTALQKLDLSHNEIQGIGFMTIKDALLENRSLESLGINQVGVKLDTLQSLREVFDKNRSLCDLSFSTQRPRSRELRELERAKDTAMTRNTQARSLQTLDRISPLPRVVIRHVESFLGTEIPGKDINQSRSF
jgi:Ran GTPase-activating protein (RanGAP) involved in mRNA processing and transport